jgi:acyl-CoA synthetase (AMP-forming)/AMP-acid ligase II
VFIMSNQRVLPEYRPPQSPADAPDTTPASSAPPDGARGTAFVGASLVELLRFRAAAQPDQCACTFLEDGEREADSVTYAELDDRARAIAARLQRQLAPGARVLLIYPPGLEFIGAFFACLYADVIAVPAFPPGGGRSASRSGSQRLARLAAICADAEPSAVLTTSELTRHLCFAPDLEVIASDEILDGGAAWQDPAAGRSTIAFLQYTSGSTAVPKGVMVTHGNLLHNLAYAFHLAENDASTVSVSWLPVVHDMGLIDGVLQPIYSGCPAYLMSPAAFLQRPARWLRAISRYRATRSGAPNFAYDLCVRRISMADRETLDLSTWRAAYNGAEPVRRETLEAFSQAFAGCGFRPSSFRPSFGLAESTLLVSSDRWRPPGASTLERQPPAPWSVSAQYPEASAPGPVSCGRPSFGTRLLIVDPATGHPCAREATGEIWVAGPSVARGYWNRPEENDHSFSAYASDGQGPFLRTGDLGFLRDGDLYVTGRLRDVLIVRGVKHYPQDLEHTVSRQHRSLFAGTVAAFALDRGPSGDRIGVAAETDPRAVDLAGTGSGLIAEIRVAVAEAHGVQLCAVLLVPCGAIPRTTSGKLQRSACAEHVKHGRLPILVDWRDTDVCNR